MVRIGKVSSKTSKLRFSQKQLEIRLEQERLRQIEESSSSTFESASSGSTISSQETVEEEEGVLNLLEALQLSESESGDDNDPEYLLRPQIYSQIDFFENLGNVPDVDNLSEDISLPSVESKKKLQRVVDRNADTGKFVNPLTGLEESSESGSTKVEVEEEAEEEELIQEEEDVSLDFQFSEESKVDVLDHGEEKQPDEFETLEAFFELQVEAQKPEIVELDFEAMAREEEARALQKNTLTFLNNLIHKVVNCVEYLSPEKILQQNLDKRKLILELADKLQHYHFAKNQCSFLNMQAVKHFRRKKSYRSILEDNEKTLKRDKQNLIKAKERLNEILARETKLLHAADGLRDDLTTQFNKLKNDAESEIQAFESKVRKNLGRDSWPKLNADIDKMLKHMARYRQEVSEARFALFLQQHTGAKLTELIKQMEDLGNGLTMRGFSTLQAETQALDKKIEERNGDLNKLYIRCRNDIHILAHFKENQQILADTINIQRSILNSLIDEKRRLRESLFSFKLQRNRLHSKINKLSVQGGLLDKPALMYDYDVTDKLIEEKKEMIDYLKQNYLVIQRKLDILLEHSTNVKL